MESPRPLYLFGIAPDPDNAGVGNVLIMLNVFQPHRRMRLLYYGSDNMKNSHLKLRALCEGAILTAVAVVLSFLPVYRLPQGGSFSVDMLPILIYCVRWGFGPAMTVSTVYGILQMFIEGGVAIGWQSIIGDFVIAYAVLGVAGLFSGRKNSFFTGSVVACTARFCVHWVVGATIWADYMPDRFFNMTMTSPWLYSALYNGSFMLADLLICLAAGALLMKPIGKYLRGEDLA